MRYAYAYNVDASAHADVYAVAVDAYADADTYVDAGADTSADVDAYAADANTYGYDANTDVYATDDTDEGEEEP